MADAPTRMTPDWIARVIQQNPLKELEGDNIRLCPARIGFPHLDKPQKAMEDGKADKYTATILFQPGTDLSLAKTIAARVGEAKWGAQFASHAQGQNFHNPFKDQGEKTQFQGFVPGLPFITATAERKPPLVMQNLAPYAGLIYPGFWAICVVRPFAFETKNKQGAVLKRGLSFGLQSIMHIADDEEWGGGGVDASTAFAGVQVDANVNPAAAFGAAGETAGEHAAAASVFG
jgi:hypothetical protein